MRDNPSTNLYNAFTIMRSQTKVSDMRLARQCEDAALHKRIRLRDLF